MAEEVLPKEWMTMNHWPSGEMLEETAGHSKQRNEARRPRITKACDYCRRKKIKCDGGQPCKICAQHNHACTYTYVEKKRRPPPSAKYVESLEIRLQRMEALLKQAHVIRPEDGAEVDLARLEQRLHLEPQIALDHHSVDSSPNFSPDVSSESPGPLLDRQASDTDHNIADLADKMCSLMVNESGSTKFIGSSSGFSIISPRGVQWVNERMGNNSFEKFITEGRNHEHTWKSGVYETLFERRIFRALPSKEEALPLIQLFFDTFNNVTPLFDQTVFMELFDQQYSGSPSPSSGWWASYNVALAIAYRFHADMTHSPTVNDIGWTYLKNALATITELSIRNTDLLSVQALLGATLYLMGTSNPQPPYVIVAAAIRLAHSIGLHRKASNFGLEPRLAQQRQRVFWILFAVDKDLSLMSGRPHALDDEDMNVELPALEPDDGLGHIALTSGKFNYFRKMAEMAIIRSQIYRRLYATHASRQTSGQLLQAIGDLDSQIERWKESIPLAIRPGTELRMEDLSALMPLLAMHFSYYRCLHVIHQMLSQPGVWTTRLAEYAKQGLNSRPLNARIFASTEICNEGARSSIGLMAKIPRQCTSYTTLVLLYPVLAFLVLFTNILQNPKHPQIASDLRCMQSVITFLSAFSAEESKHDTQRKLKGCTEFMRIAQQIIDKHKSGRIPISLQPQPSWSPGASDSQSGSHTDFPSTPPQESAFLDLGVHPNDDFAPIAPLAPVHTSDRHVQPLQKFSQDHQFNDFGQSRDWWDVDKIFDLDWTSMDVDTQFSEH